jgi:hypothetical protein
MSVQQSLYAFIASVFIATPGFAQLAAIPNAPAGNDGSSAIAAPEPQPGHVSGTAIDVDDEVIPGANVILEGPSPEEKRTVVANDSGVFAFDNLKPGTAYHITISADGFVSWTSAAIVVAPGQFLFLSDTKLAISGGATSVTVSSSSEEIATEQVKIEEQQRVLGFIPNFYVVYDHDPAPLTTKLKFKLALRAETDPITFVGVAFVAGLNQAGTTPNYGQGAAGYGQRLGALYANGFDDIMIGGAILPSLLHQDPRYFYQGTGTKKSRVVHAISSPFICKGDDGRWMPNYSSVGGDLATGAISNLYYPESNRGPGLVFANAAIVTGGRMVNGLIQEFFLRRLTPSARNQSY